MEESAEVPHELVFNGVNGATGDYWLPPISAAVVSKLAQGERIDPQELAELKARYHAATEKYFNVVEGVDPTSLGESGWGVIFAHGADPAIRDALDPLLEHRRRQASVEAPNRYCEFTGPDAVRPGQTHRSWLARFGALPENPANPEKVPYYLLIVGDPETIPYRFQYGLDVTYAVGRIAFDTVDEYARYADAVVQAETNPIPRRRGAFFGARNEDDRATPLSSDHLILPLAERLASKFNAWTFVTHHADGKNADGPATKAGLRNILSGEEIPSLLFTATHGMVFDNGDPRQLAHQGALICQDWPGPREWGRRPIPDDFYFSGDDAAHVTPAGVLAFFFACYGAGTPKTDDFAYEVLGTPAAIAPHAFLGRLPQRLLAHPSGGALAVVGHVERAWSYSFLWPGVGEQLDAFEGTLASLLKGVPLGAAIEPFNIKYTALTTELESAREDIKYGAVPDVVGLSGMWTAKNDARNYVILGDPAVRLVA
jgi:hypothetical protein